MTDPHLDVAGYALDALTDDERAAFESHLADCTDCQQQLREFTETTADLSTDMETSPPDQLRTNVLAAIAETPQLDSESVADETGSPAAEPAAPSAAGPPEVAHVSPAPRRRSRTWRRIGQIAVAAAVAVVLAIGGWVVGRQQLGQSVHAEESARTRLLRAPDAQIHRQPMKGHGTVSYVVSQKRNKAMAIVSGKPKAGSGHTFQMWTMHGPKGNQPKPDRTFSGGSSKPIWLKGNVSDAAAVAITVEPDGGSQKPTTNPFAVQKL